MGGFRRGIRFVRSQELIFESRPSFFRKTVPYNNVYFFVEKKILSLLILFWGPIMGGVPPPVSSPLKGITIRPYGGKHLRPVASIFWNTPG